MKLLMESWRKFINEDVYGEDFLKTLGLTYQLEEGDFLVQIVHQNEMNGQLSVIGMIETMEMADQTSGRSTPCIPETYEIGAVAVEPQFRGKGLGTWLYEVVSVLISQKGDGGLTSDHSASTTKDAATVWKRLENDLNYIKRQTPKGPDEETYDMKTGEVFPAYKGQNDKFDYNGSTPDPKDDCYPPSEGKAATDHSLKIPPSRIPEVAKIMDIQMKNYDSWTENLHIATQGKASQLFNKAYKPDESGIYGNED
jgi:GNAT superfamily N-acetyltransferase